MALIEVFKSETVISSALIEAPSPEQALKYARVVSGMPNEPQYTEVSRRSPRLSLSPDINKREKSAEEEKDAVTPPVRAIPAAHVAKAPIPAPKPKA